jgi:hypothetical protein
VRGLLEARAHNVLYMLGESPTMVVKNQMGGKKQIATTGKIARVIHTKPTGAFFAKSRLNLDEFYEVEHTETDEDLLKHTTNPTLIKLFDDIYR